MKKDYILDHKWGSYERKINKLKLRNLEDLKKYLINILPTIYIAEITQDFTFKFLNGNKYKIMLEI